MPSVMLPETAPDVAVIVVPPAATAVAMPPVVIAAIEEADELQVTDVVRFWAVLSENVPVATNCWVVPTVMLGVAGVTVIAVRCGATVGCHNVNVIVPVLPFETDSKAV